MAYDIYFAFTPLHLKIVNAIPKENKSILVLLSNKNLNSFEASYIDDNKFIKIFRYQSNYFNPLNLMMINKKYRNIQNLYVGNFKFFNFRLIEFFINYRKLFTFDDGIGGITKTYFNTYSNSPKEIIYSFFKVDISSIIKKHIKHYGIYNTTGGVFRHKTVPLNLKNRNKKFPYTGNVLLTTDKSEAGTMSKIDEKILMQKIINKFNIKYLIHHPSKKYNRDFKNVDIINDAYLADDIVSYSNFNHVYSLSASSILGILKLNSFPEDKITYLANKNAPVMNLLQSKTKINSISFESL